MDLKARVVIETLKASGDLEKLGKSAKELEEELNKAGKAARKSGNDFDLMGKAAKGMAALGGAAVAGLTALGAGISQSVALARESAAEQAQLKAVLESTGSAAGMTAEEVNKLAQQMMGLTNFDDDAVLSGQNLLLTFTNIGRDVFPQATEAMLDLSVKMKQDLKSSAVQLGKALNDPVAGATALTRVGVKLTEEQQALIASLVETGDVAGAQKIILNELSVEFGGSARAAREADGGFIALQNSLGNLGEAAGAPWLEMMKTGMPGLDQAVKDLTPTVVELSGAMADFAASASGAMDGDTVAALKEAGSWATAFFDALSNGVTAWQGIGDNATAALDIIQSGFANAFAPIDSFFQSIYGAISGFYNMMGMDLPPTWEEQMANLAGAALNTVPAVNAAGKAIEAVAGVANEMGRGITDARTANQLLAGSMREVDLGVAGLRAGVDASRALAEGEEVLAESARQLGDEALTAAEKVAILAQAQTSAAMAASNSAYAARYTGQGGGSGQSATEMDAIARQKYITATLASLDTLKEKEAAAAKDATAAWQKSYDDRTSAAQSAVSSVLGEGFNVLSDLNLGLDNENTGRAIAEDARRLASIAAGDFSGEAARLLQESNPQLFSKVMASENPQEVAKGILSDFQMGIDTYGLIDPEAAKARINRMLFAGEQRQSLIDQITQEIMAEGQYSAGQIQQAVGAEFGAATGQVQAALPEEQLAQVQAISAEIGGIGASAETAAATMTEAFAGTKEPLDTLQLALAEVVKILERVQTVATDAAGAVTGVGNSVGLPAGGTAGTISAAGVGGVPSVPAFATGGTVVVPGSGGTDSRLFQARVSPGERIDFTPPGQAQAAPVVVKLYLDSAQIAQVVGNRQAAAAEQLARMGGYANLFAAGGAPSYEKWLTLRVDAAPDNGVTDFEVWGDGAVDSHTTLYAGVTGTGATPVNTTSTVATADFDTYVTGNRLTWDSSSLTEVGDVTDFLVLQLVADASAEPGNWTQEIIYYSYTET